VSARHVGNRVEQQSEFGGQIPVDLKADADFDESRSRPDHETFLLFQFMSRVKMIAPNRQGDNSLNLAVPSLGRRAIAL